MGAHLKNTIALGYKDQVVLSPHIGDLDTPEALDGLNEVVKTLPRFLEKAPGIVAIDMHPDMHSSRLGRMFAKEYELPLVEVQHHHAHALSCMAENSLDEAIAVVFDGTGLGTDGRIWGGEVFHLKPGKISHLATFSGAPLPGGDAAILRPGRQLFARWIQAGVPVPEQWLSKLFQEKESALVIEQQIQRALNTPITTAAGRVFDSFSTWLGISPEITTYDGQAAIRLEAIARYAEGGSLPHLPDLRNNIKGNQLEIDWQSFFTELAQLPQPDKAQLPHWALAFHVRMAEAAHQMITHARQLHDTRDICLSGGVFMNRVLCERLNELLKEDDLLVHIQRQVPPNDGGISLGQVCYTSGAYESVSKPKKDN